MLASFMIDVSIKNHRIASDTLNKTKAYYSAESGIYDFINYVNSKNCNVSSGTTITNLYNNGGLYADNMAVYKANLVEPITNTVTTTNIGNLTVYTKTYTFDIYSSGSYGSQGCVIVADASIIYTSNDNVNFSYSSYSINSKKVYKD
jgi:hypothetical protein